MKKIRKLIVAGLLALFACTGIIVTKSVSKSDSVLAEIPEGQTLDGTYDEISVSDLTANELSGQSMLYKNSNYGASFTQNDAEKSLVFKFKYDVVDATNTNKIAFRIHFDVADDQWNSDNALWIRGDGVYLSKYESSAFGWSSRTALSKGVHEIEFGRLALLEGGTPTGNYYTYYKVDGVEANSKINPYDSSKMGNTMFFNFSEKNTMNKVYDANLTYETPKYVSISDFNEAQSDKIAATGAQYTYGTAGMPTNKSVSLVTNIYYKENVDGEEGSQFYLSSPTKDWKTEGYIWVKKDKVHFGITNEDGSINKSNEVAYPNELKLDVGDTVQIEYSRLAIMNGDTFTGKYHVSYKLDGTLIYAIDQAVSDDVKAGGMIQVTGKGEFELQDAYTYETPKEISVGDLRKNGVLVGESIVMNAQQVYTYDNDDHADHYSIKFSTKYDVKASEEHQFHFSNDNLGHPSSFIIEGTTIHLGKTPDGYTNVSKTLSEGVHNVEFARLAKLIGGKFTGEYYISLKIDGEIVSTQSYPCSDALVSSSNIFITGGDGKVNTIYDSSLDLTKKTTPSFTAAAADTGVTFDLIPGWKTSGAYIEFDSSYSSFMFDLRSSLKPGTRLSEKLTMNGTKISGNPDDYYHYKIRLNLLATNGDTGASSVDTLQFRSACDYANLKVTSGIEYEDADTISVSDLSSGGNKVGDSITLDAQKTFSYTSTSAHKSTVFLFKYETSDASKVACQVHFNDGFIPDADGGVVWMRDDNTFIRKDASGGYVSAGKATFAAAGTHEVEIGKLYITAGGNKGKYYIYIKVGGVLFVDYVTAKMPDKANIFTTGTNGDVLHNVVTTEYDKNPDIVSISNASVDGKTNLNEFTNENHDLTYTKTNDNYSVVFKCKYEVTDATKPENCDKAGFRVHFDVADDKWNDNNSFMIRPDNVFFKKYNGTELKWATTSALKVGTYDIEFGRLAILNKGVATGKYYVYYKINGELKDSFEYAYDISKMSNTMFINIGKDHTYNHVYDCEYVPTTYETADQISVSNLKYANDSSVGDYVSLNEHKNFKYTATATNKSAVFTFKYEVTDPNNTSCQIHFSDGWISAPNGGMVWLSKDKIHIQKDANPAAYVSKNSPLTTAGVYNIEIGKLYITAGGNYATGSLAGKYYIYIKVNGTLVADNYVSSMPNKAAIFTTATNGDHIYDKDYVVPTFETADQITVSDLLYNDNPVLRKSDLSKSKTYSYNSTATNKSVVFKFNYVVTDQTKIGSQIHFSNTWLGDNHGGIIWLKNDKNRISKVGSGYLEAAPLSKAGTYLIETGKLYISAGTDAGKYYIYLKVDGKLALEYIIADMPDKANIFMTGGNDDYIYDVDYTFPTYETADNISVGDLRVSGALVGNEIQLNSATAYSYNATATHKSVVFDFKYVVTTKDAASCQFHFNDNYISAPNGSMVWLTYNKLHLQLDAESAKYYSSTISLGEIGTYEIQIGKLYITAGSDKGKYYIYAKVDGNLVAETIVASMPDKANIFTTGDNGDYLYDIDYVPVAYETADEISIHNLKIDGYSVGNDIEMVATQTYSYDATAAHKSVVLKYLYEVNDPSKIAYQVHFSNTWLGDTHGGIVWLRDDYNFISKVGGGYLSTSPITKAGIYNIEIGKIYMTAGADAGKYYMYLSINGNKELEYVIADMPDKANIFLTGSNGDHLYDIKYVPINVDAGLYLYKWDVSRSGILFTASFRKELVTMKSITKVEFYILPNDNAEEVKIVEGKMVESNDYYVVKAALVGILDANITREYCAFIMVYMPNNICVSNPVYTTLYDQLSDLTGYEAYETELKAIKDKVLVVTVDEDNFAVTGATKSGDSAALELTGANESYSAFMVNGKSVKNDDKIMIGYYTYKVTLEANKITLTRVEKSMVYGGSEHFVELNSGHDDNMTAKNLAPMASELGLGSIRLDIDLANLFTVTANDELVVNKGAVLKVQAVLNELKRNGKVNDFLAVLWTVQPTGYTTTNGTWKQKSAPDPVNDPEMYLKWLRLNGEAARRAAELFPDITNYETWNEPEIVSTNCTLSKTDKTHFTVEEKAKILTDLMYYYNAGIKAANPNNVLTTPSLCCASTTSTTFPVTSPGFLTALYDAIIDDVPVTGYTVTDKEANNYFQVINIHPYLGYGTNTSNWTNYVKSFSEIATKYEDGGTEVWITEFGFAQNRESNAQTLMLNILNQAKNIDCLTKFYFYKIHDYTSKIDNDRWGLYNYDGTIKAIGTAVKEVINPVTD